MKEGDCENLAWIYQGLITFIVFCHKVTGTMNKGSAVHIRCLYFSKAVAVSQSLIPKFIDMGWKSRQ